MEWQALLDQVNIVDYIRQYTELTERAGELWGNCPLHIEDTPSFSVSEEKQTFYCFGCNRGGNLLSFVMEYNNCDFVSAIKLIKDFYKIKDDSSYFEVPDILKTLRKFKGFNKKELAHRDIIADNAIDKYTHENINEWITEGISQDIMDKFNVRYNKYNNSIIFEVRGNDGKLISLKERTLNSEWKDLGLRKYSYISKIGCNDFLWGYYLNKDACYLENEIIIVESEKSVMKLMTWGINNCVASCTSHISDEQLEVLIRSKLNVVVAFDNDKKQAVLKDEMWKRLKRFCKVYVVIDNNNILGEKDAPVDRGLEVWNKLYDKRKILS